MTHIQKGFSIAGLISLLWSALDAWGNLEFAYEKIQKLFADHPAISEIVLAEQTPRRIVLLCFFAILLIQVIQSRFSIKGRNLRLLYKIEQRLQTLKEFVNSPQHDLFAPESAHEESPLGVVSVLPDSLTEQVEDLINTDNARYSRLHQLLSRLNHDLGVFGNAPCITTFRGADNGIDACFEEIATIRASYR
jgi:hypothetical protein